MLKVFKAVKLQQFVCIKLKHFQVFIENINVKITSTATRYENFVSVDSSLRYAIFKKQCVFEVFEYIINECDVLSMQRKKA